MRRPTPFQDMELLAMTIHRKSIVVVGLDASPPRPLHTGHPGEGFEVDLLKAVAERLGFEIRYESCLWSELVQRLMDRKLNMICSAATITDERRQIVDFSEPYLEFKLALVVHRDNRDIRGVADLMAKSV